MKKNKAEVFQPSGETRRVQSLGGGRWIRIFDDQSKGHQLAVDDTDGIAALYRKVAEINEPLARRIVDELAALGVDVVLEAEEGDGGEG